MNIKELLELADKQTIFGNETQINTFGTWGKDNKAFIKASPEMAVKLREIVDILPEINRLLELHYHTDLEDEAHAAMLKLTLWENN